MGFDESAWQPWFTKLFILMAFPVTFGLSLVMNVRKDGIGCLFHFVLVD